MGFWGMLKANLWAIRNESKLETALKINDKGETKRIVLGIVRIILKTGLSSKEKSIFKEIFKAHRKGVSNFFAKAFYRGWMGAGYPNLSNAMDEVLRQAIVFIEEHNKSAEK